jgi:hypothetical protein
MEELSERRRAHSVGRDGSGNQNEELIYGRAMKWPVVVLNVLADRVKRILAAQRLASPAARLTLPAFPVAALRLAPPHGAAK